MLGSMQARLNQSDPRLYSVNRDVAHNFAYVIEETAKRIEAGNWKPLVAYGENAGLCDEDLGAGCQVLIRFVLGQLDFPKEGMSASLQRAGFFDLPEEVRIILMAHLGSIVLGIYWVGVHEATLGGEGPLLTCKQLQEHGAQCAKLMSVPRWRRGLFKFWLRALEVWRVLQRGSNGIRDTGRERTTPS